MSKHAPEVYAHDLPENTRVAIVAARFNAHIVDQLLVSCEERLAEIGLATQNVEVHRVPGAFELPVAAKMLGNTGTFAAIICLGCVIRGDTPHFDYVAGQAARGIQHVAIELGIPVIFGVLTTENEHQAKQRTDAGARAADAAAEMIALAARVQGRKA